MEGIIDDICIKVLVMKYFAWILVLFLGITACNSDSCDLPVPASKERCDGPESTGGLNALELMDVYVAENNLNVTKTTDNLYYVIMDAGDGDEPDLSASVTVDYVGYYRNGCSFDSSNGISFGLTNLIRGWQNGIPLVGKCGSVLLIVPPSLAYGANPSNGITAGEPLIFEINLRDWE